MHTMHLFINAMQSDTMCHSHSLDCKEAKYDHTIRTFKGERNQLINYPSASLSVAQHITGDFRVVCGVEVQPA